MISDLRRPVISAHLSTKKQITSCAVGHSVLCLFRAISIPHFDLSKFIPFRPLGFMRLASLVTRIYFN